MSDFKVVTPSTPKAVRNALEYTKAQGVIGDYYEFGVYTGFLFWKTFAAIKELQLDYVNLIGFDSFEGLPDVVGPDAGWAFSEGDYKCSFAEAWTNLDERGIDWGRARLLKLWFDQLPKYRLSNKEIMVAAIDCDLYHSTVPVLEFLERLLQDHCVLVFDDWNCFDADPDKGQRRAFREFLAANKHWVAVPFEEFDWHGKSFIMRRIDLYEAEYDDLSYYTSWT